MPPAEGSDRAAATRSESLAARATTRAADLWRAVETQHVASTMALVDSLAEQEVLERVIDEGKPPLPPAARRLDYLLFTPFRYPPPSGGSRFRGDNDPGVFYAADAVRTACAELGYWRWRHLCDSPGLISMPTRSQTVFRTRVATRMVDLREPPFDADRGLWTHPRDYAACQAFAREARSARLGAIRYESVRDPEHGGCCAVLEPEAFAKRAPLEQQSWALSVFRDRVIWQRVPGTGVAPRSFEFLAATWAAAATGAARPGRRPAARARRRP